MIGDSVAPADAPTIAIGVINNQTVGMLTKQNPVGCLGDH